MSNILKYNDEWIHLDAVEEVYENISKGSLSTLASKYKKAGKDTSNWYKQVGGKSIMINMGYLRYVWERRRRIQFYCQEEYYNLVDIYGNSTLALMFSKFAGVTQQNAVMFFNNTLFANTYFINLSKIRISGRLIKFHNFINELKDELVFDSVEDEYDYYEATKIKGKL